MKKIMIALMVLSGGLLFALKDTLFTVENSELKNTIRIEIPDSVYTTKATLKQNVEAWYYGKKPIILVSEETRYEWFIRKNTPIIKTLEFNGVKNVIVPKIGAPVESKPYELIFVFLISFLATSFLQRCVYKKSYSQVNYFFVFILVLAIISTTLFANDFIKPISFTLWFLLILGLFLLMDVELKISKRRTLFILSGIFLGGIIGIFSPNYILVYYFYVAGLILALPSFYYWRYRISKKLSR